MQQFFFLSPLFWYSECIFRTFRSYYVLWLTACLTTVWQLSVLKASMLLRCNVLTRLASHTSSEVAECAWQYLFYLHRYVLSVCPEMRTKWGCSRGNSFNIVKYITSSETQRSTRNRKERVATPFSFLRHTAYTYAKLWFQKISTNATVHPCGEGD